MQSFPRVLLELTKCVNKGIEKLVGTFLGGSDQSSVFTLVHGLRNVVQCIPEYVQLLATTFDHKAVQSGPGNFHGQVKLDGMVAKYMYVNAYLDFQIKNTRFEFVLKDFIL